MPLLFSYGTLQQEKVQLSTFGRRLDGQEDQLPRFEQSLVRIEDPKVATTIGQTHHANVKFNGNDDSRVPGMVFEITDDELASVDEYEAAFDMGELSRCSRRTDNVGVRPRKRSGRCLMNVACNATPAFQGQESTMTVHLDHLLVPSRNKIASAKLLAELLGVPWSETGVGPFAPVYVNDGLTFDFDEWTDPIPLIHYCFRVGQEDFSVILERIKAAGIPFRSNVHGPVDFQVNTQHGGSIVYWNEPDGHQWEMLTVSYARQA